MGSQVRILFAAPVFFHLKKQRPQALRHGVLSKISPYLDCVGRPLSVMFGLKSYSSLSDPAQSRKLKKLLGVDRIQGSTSGHRDGTWLAALNS